MIPLWRDQTGTYCGLSLAPFFVEQLPQLEVLHLDGVDNVVVGGLAVAHQMRAKQGEFSSNFVVQPEEDSSSAQKILKI